MSPDLCPAPWCGKDREECAHLECPRRRTPTACPPLYERPRLPDEDADRRAERE